MVVLAYCGESRASPTGRKRGDSIATLPGTSKDGAPDGGAIMFTRFAIGLLLATVLPLAAQADDCLTVHIDHDEHGPQVVETEGWPEISFPGRMGDDLWFQWDGDPFSVDVADPAIESVTACADGSVDVHREEPTVEFPAELVDLIVVLVRLSLIF